MPTYLLVLRRPASGRPPWGPEEIQAILGRYKAWADRMRQAGHLAGGNKLADQPGRILRKSSELRITDGPFVETKDVIGGYFLLEASGYDQAVELAKDCPHLEFGSIEIREIEAT